MKYLEIIGLIILCLMFAYIVSKSAAKDTLQEFNSKHTIIIMPESDTKYVVRDIEQERAKKNYHRKQK